MKYYIRMIGLQLILFLITGCGVDIFKSEKLESKISVDGVGEDWANIPLTYIEDMEMVIGFANNDTTLNSNLDGVLGEISSDTKVLGLGIEIGAMTEEEREEMKQRMAERGGKARSSGGMQGGFRICQSCEPIFLYQIIDVVDGLSDYDRCVLGFDTCSEENPCSLHQHWLPHLNGIKKMIYSVNLQDLTEINTMAEEMRYRAGK